MQYQVKRQYEAYTENYPHGTLCLNCGHSLGTHYFIRARKEDTERGDCSTCPAENKKCLQFLPNIPEVLNMIDDLNIADNNYLQEYLEGVC